MIDPVRAQAPAAAGNEKKLLEVARNFESIFVQMLLKSMRSGIQKSELLSGGRGEEVFTGLLDQHLADATSRRGEGLGLAKTIVSKYSGRVGESRGTLLDVK